MVKNKTCNRIQKAVRFLFFVAFIMFLSVPANGQKMPPSYEKSKTMPVEYVGKQQTDKRYYDGRLRHAVGVHIYEALRSNRKNPPEIGSRTGWTYNHQPYLCYWNGQFYLEYLSDQYTENLPPGRTLLMTSRDGRHWSNPEIIFPEYTLPEINYTDPGSGKTYHLPAGTKSVMHQRMGFYVTSGNHLLALAFYSYPMHVRGNANNGQGLGRVVREVYKDGTLGPIYFIRYNRHSGWNESNTKYPFYKKSPDKGFVKDCEELLSNKLITLQWWEEDRSKDGFYSLNPVNKVTEAFNFFHRPDGVVVGLWKHSLTALSPDNGHTWSDFVNATSFKTCGAKIWGQKTKDGRYAIVYDNSATGRNRYPMVVMTSEDGHDFNHMLCLDGEVPPMRHYGWAKNVGSQYIRGIIEGNGDPPGNYMWNTFSVNKEDIWVSRTTLPITGIVKKQVDQDFEGLKSEEDLNYWNLYIPKWAPIDIVKIPGTKNHVLQLTDEEPYDYACAERAFPPSSKETIEFRVFIKDLGKDILEFELRNENDYRALRLRFDPRHYGLAFDLGKTETSPVPVSENKWYTVKLSFDCAKGRYNVWLNGKEVKEGVKFNITTKTLERMVFRTGSWRQDVRQLLINGEASAPGLETEDLAGADSKVAKSVFWIDNVKTTGE